MNGFDPRFRDFPGCIMGIRPMAPETDRPGPCTGRGNDSAAVIVPDITHAELGPGGLRRDHTLIDETAIWRQILLHQGAR